MTDLRHIAQLLHEAGVSEGLGPTAMATWLGRRIHDAERDADNEERARRLESDAEAVQVITIHRSKGLEFPIVYCPFTWDGRASKSEVPVFHDPADGQPADHRRGRTRATSFDGTPEAGARGGARRGPAPALRGADPRPAPGDAVVGRRHATASIRRWPGCSSTATPAGSSPRTAQARSDPTSRGRRRRGAGPPRGGRAGRPAERRCAGRPTPRTRRLARGRPVRPHARHRVATGLVLEHHRAPCTTTQPSGASPSQRLSRSTTRRS